MALDQRYIPAFSIEDVLLDKDTGAPLSGGLVYFEQDNQRGVLKPVYQITGTSPNYSYVQLQNPVVLSSIGTFEDALGNPVIPYFFPYDANGDLEYYYVRVTNADGVEQFTREAVPYVYTAANDEVKNTLVNELSNPQFSEVNFDTSTADYTYNFNTVSGEVISIAPTWDLVVSAPGVATVTVSQQTPSGTLNIETNPGTILTIQSGGVSSLQLRQRLFGSPNLWGSGYIAGTFVARTDSGTDVVLNMYYSQSDGSVVDQLIVSKTLPQSGAYVRATGSSDFIPISTSNDTFPDAYVDIYFDIPVGIKIELTSVMVASTGDISIADINYDQESNARQTDHLFNYYEAALNYKPIPSLMTGWDFPLNPAQARGTTVTMVNTGADYIWDQTICRSFAGNVSVVRNSVTGGFQATTTTGNEAFYMLQYLRGNQAKEFVGARLSLNLNAYRTQTGGAVTAKVYMYRATTAASFPSLPTTIGTIDSAGDFTLTAAGWTQINRANFGQASATLPTVTTTSYSTINTITDMEFSGWEITDSAQISDTDKIAVVVTFKCPTTNTTVIVDSIGVMKGDIGTRPAPQTLAEVMSDCQMYYETSYNTGVVPGTASAASGIWRVMHTQFVITGGAVPNQVYVFASPFSVDYHVEKVASNPAIALYNPNITTIDTALARVYYAENTVGFPFQTASNSITPSAYWTITASKKSARFEPLTKTALVSTVNASFDPMQVFCSGGIFYHYVVDGRIGYYN